MLILWDPRGVFCFFFWILLGIIGLNLNSNCMFFGLFHISWLLILFFFHVGEEGGEKCHSVVENNKTHCLLFGLCSIASSGSRQLIFSTFNYELLGWKCSLFLSDQHMDVWSAQTLGQFYSPASWSSGFLWILTRDHINCPS